jgi:hypothetical protein
MSGTMRSLALVTGLAVALPGLTPQATAAAPQAAMPMRIHPSGARIWYPASSYPELSLPDGRHEVVRSMLNVATPMHFGNFVWDEDGIAGGPVGVRIDLTRQLLSVFRGGHEIGSAVIRFGTDGKLTPTGIFTILEKDADHYSHSYDAPMPYMLRLTKDGVAIHGSNVREGWATHGCIGVPLEFARLLFAVASKGDLIAILPAPSGAGMPKAQSH